MTLQVQWHDGGREPSSPPDPGAPHGVVVDLSNHAVRTCKTSLPYPARRCGTYVIACDVCGLTAAVTTAGRADDPYLVQVACKP